MSTVTLGQILRMLREFERKELGLRSGQLSVAADIAIRKALLSEAKAKRVQAMSTFGRYPTLEIAGLRWEFSSQSDLDNLLEELGLLPEA